MTLRRAVRRLRLRKGDILIVRDHSVARQLESIRLPASIGRIPIIYARSKNDLLRMTREELLRWVGEHPQ